MPRYYSPLTPVVPPADRDGEHAPDLAGGDAVLGSASRERRVRRRA